MYVDGTGISPKCNNTSSVYKEGVSDMAFDFLIICDYNGTADDAVKAIGAEVGDIIVFDQDINITEETVAVYGLNGYLIKADK